MIPPLCYQVHLPIFATLLAPAGECCGLMINWNFASSFSTLRSDNDDDIDDLSLSLVTFERSNFLFWPATPEKELRQSHEVKMKKCKMRKIKILHTLKWVLMSFVASLARFVNSCAIMLFFCLIVESIFSFLAFIELWKCEKIWNFVFHPAPSASKLIWRTELLPRLRFVPLAKKGFSQTC